MLTKELEISHTLVTAYGIANCNLIDDWIADSLPEKLINPCKELKEKEKEKYEKHIGKVFRKKPNTKGVC